MSQLSPSTQAPYWSTGSADKINLEDFFGYFVLQHGRGLRPRARRHLAELMELLGEYLADQGVTTVGRATRGNVVSVSACLQWIDLFEQGEMYDALDGERDKLRVADAAMRALTRQLGALLR